MFYLVATILLNVVVFTVLKLFPKFGIHSLQALVANYCVCVVTGCIFTGNIPFTAATLHADWFPWSLLMGVAFISIFSLTAFCTRIDGMATTVMASKLSLVIPVIFSILFYGEASGAGKITGIVLAFPAVYLSTRTNGGNSKPISLFWPALLFIFSGSLDTLVNYVQESFLHTRNAQAAYTIVCFAMAGLSGLALVLVLLAKGKISFEWKNLIAGICLGVPNFFSIYFLVLTLNSNIFQSSATIPLVNISILVGSTLAAILFFREHAGKWRVLGILIAVIAILLIGLGDTPGGIF